MPMPIDFDDLFRQGFQQKKTMLEKRNAAKVVYGMLEALCPLMFQHYKGQWGQLNDLLKAEIVTATNCILKQDLATATSHVQRVGILHQVCK